MGNFGSKVNDFVDDLKHSWWFRFWVVFWVVCFVIGFTAFVLFSARSSEDQSEKGWRFWLKEEKEMTLPKFQFRAQVDKNDGGNLINSASCTWKDSLLVNQGPCNEKDPTTVCVEFDASGITVDKTTNHIKCLVNMTEPFMKIGNDNYLAFRVASGITFDKDNLDDVWRWLQPSEGIFIDLNMIRVKPGKKWETIWRPSVHYRNDIVTKDLFTVNLQIDSFHIFNYEKTDWYTGWMAAADFGGFTFFLTIIHWISMNFLAIFLEKNSKFLGITGNGPERAQYNTL